MNSVLYGKMIHPSPSSLRDATRPRAPSLALRAIHLVSPRRGKKDRLKLTRAIYISQHNPQSSPSAMPAPFQGAYKSSTNLRQSAFDKHFISPLKGEVAASFCEQTEGLRYINRDTIYPSSSHLHKRSCQRQLLPKSIINNQYPSINQQD